jgi:hypothetical protein
MLNKNPETRLTVPEALAHPWICQDASAPATLLSRVVVERLQSFTRTTRLERLLLNVAAHQLTSQEIDRLGAMFRALDHDGDGCAPPLFRSSCLRYMLLCTRACCHVWVCHVAGVPVFRHVICICIGVDTVDGA